MLKNLFKIATLSAVMAVGTSACGDKTTPTLSSEKDFLKVDGHNIVDSKGEKFYIKGTNLGNWCNPEGYMFGFSRANSYSMINDVMTQLFGPTEAAEFWKKFKKNYITEADIRFIASKGANTIRFPFHYKLFTAEPFMGESSADAGYETVDSLVAWCGRNNLRLILDMHDCPGGQTGDNIDDSAGYPFLITDTVSQTRFINLWENIAARYADEPVILGYELMNEPIATFWNEEETAALNAALEPLYIKTVKAIREKDSNHIILLGAPQWNSNFEPFTDWTFDDNIMYTCHRYGGPATADAIRSYIDFRDKTGLPMYMGEIGHNTDEWMSDFVDVMRENNIGYTFWPYKKIEDSSMTVIATPEGWQEIVTFAEAPRGTFAEIREARSKVNLDAARKALDSYAEGARAENMLVHDNYISAIKLDK